MQAQANASLYKRHRTRYRGITYRERSDGSRRYCVYVAGKQVAVDGGEKAALTKQAELRGKLAKGEPVAFGKRTFAQAAEEWYATKRKLRYKTREGYETALGINGRGKEHAELRLVPRFGHLRLADVNADRIAEWIRAMEGIGFSPAWIANHLKPLSGTMGFAARKGWIGQNPVLLLTADERPQPSGRVMRILDYEQVEALLAAAARRAARPTARYDYTPLFRTAIFTGLRLGELLGLRWEDVDLKAGAILVRFQLTQRRTREVPKTPNAVRRVVLAPDLARFLREHRLRSRFSGESDYVFASRSGTPLSHRNVEARGFDRTVEEAKLTGEPKLVFHDLRHVYASMMIERGVTSTELCDQMGHSHPGITERRYVHLFNRQRTEDRLRAAVQSAWDVGKSLASTGGNGRESEAPGEGSKAAFLHASGTDGS
jgi:integrase